MKAAVLILPLVLLLFMRKPVFASVSGNDVPEVNLSQYSRLLAGELNKEEASLLSWELGKGVSREGQEYASPCCMATGYVEAKMPYIHMYLHDYSSVELRILQYDQDKKLISCLVTTGNVCQKIHLEEKTAYVRAMLADWGSPGTALQTDFAQNAELEWQEYEIMTYYFSNSGSDHYPGTEKEPKKNPDAFIREGNAIIRLKGGDTFNFTLAPGDNTSITNYDSGFAIIDGTRTTEDSFISETDMIYSVQLIGDAGTVWLDNEEINWKKVKTKEELDADGEYFISHSEGKLYMFSETPLTGLHLNYTAGADGIDVKADNVEIMYLNVKNWGWHGINVINSRNVSISECMIDTIGGGQIHGTDDGPRFGNGIEVGLYGCNNVNIFQNIIRDCYDSGLTPQTWASTSGNGERVENILFDRNYVERCFWGFEYGTDKDADCPSNVSCRGNLFSSAYDVTNGYRWDGSIGPAFFCIGTSAPSSKLTAVNNQCLGSCRYGIMIYSWADASNVWFKNNSFYLDSAPKSCIRNGQKYHSQGDSWSIGETEIDPLSGQEAKPSEDVTVENPAPGSSDKHTDDTSENTLSKWAAGYGWTHDGQFRKLEAGEELFGKERRLYISALSPEFPVNVNPGETWHIRTHLGLGMSDLSPIVILDNDGNLVWEQENCATPEDGVYITIPENGSKMYITYLNGQKFILEKDVSAEETARETESSLMSLLLTTKKVNDRTENDCAYLAFTVDDTRRDLDAFADIFEDEGLPLCVGAIPECLKNCSSNGKETILDVCNRIVANGGEILSHSHVPINPDNISDMEVLVKQFAWNRAALEAEGFEVNGILLAGGEGSADADKSITGNWAKLFYAYSDDYGTEEPYAHQRVVISNMSIEGIKKRIDRAVDNKEFLVLAWHDTEEVSTEKMRDILNYVKNIPEEKLKVTTYRDYYLG